MGNMIKAIFWDNDGVLVDTEQLYFRSTQQMMATIGIELDLSTYREYFLKQSQGAWHLAKKQGISASVIETIQEKRNQLYSQLLRDESSPMQAAEHVLKTLFGHYTMAIVTTSHGNHFDIIHKRTGFRQYFDFILTREDYGKSKPHPEPYLRALAKSGYQPEECLVIEDSERGLVAAAAAGIRCWVIPTALSRGSDFTTADRILTDISEVPVYLDAL